MIHVTRRKQGLHKLSEGEEAPRNWIAVYQGQSKRNSYRGTGRGDWCDA